MEELKHEQEMRERRNQEREQWHDGRHADTSAVSNFCYLNEYESYRRSVMWTVMVC